MLSRGNQFRQSYPLKFGFAPKCAVGNFFRHFEQPLLALKLANPSTLRVAGKSQVTQTSMALMVVRERKEEGFLNETPLYSLLKSLTSGDKKELISQRGS